MAREREKTDYIQIKFRMREALRAKLENAADNVRGSLNDEGVKRLERSFDDEEKLFKDQNTMALIRLLVGTIGLIEARTGKTWIKDDHTRNAVTAVMVAMLNGDAGVPFNKRPDLDEDGEWLHDTVGLRESPHEAIVEAVTGLLKMYGATEETVEVVQRVILSDRNRPAQRKK